MGAHAQAIRVEIVDFGVYKVQIERTVVAPEDIAGHRNVVSKVRLVRKTRIIHAQPGLSFGYRYVVRGAAGHEQLTFRTIYPRMTNPGNRRTMSRQQKDFPVPIGARPTYDGYRFDHTWEMAEGIWTFQILHKGKVLTEQRFKIVVLLN